MKLSNEFIKDAQENFGWADSIVKDFTPRKVKLKRNTGLKVITDSDGNHFVDSDGEERVLDTVAYVDADSASVALALALTSRDPREHDIVQRIAHYAEDMTVNTTACAPGATAFGFTQRGFTGQSEFIGEDGEYPNVEIYGEEFFYKNKNHALGYSVTRAEVRAGVLMNTPIAQKKRMAVVHGITAKSNSIAYIGATELGETGLLNNASVTNTQAPLNAGATARTFASKTNAEVFEDFQTLFGVIETASENEVMPNRCILPSGFKSRMMSTFDSANSTNETLEMRLENAFGIKIVYRVEAKTAGTSSSAMMCLYNDAPEYVEFIQAMPMTSYPEQMIGLASDVPTECEDVGCVIYAPMAFAYMYGI